MLNRPNTAAYKVELEVDKFKLEGEKAKLRWAS
jgi:hypothetical protein